VRIGVDLGGTKIEAIALDGDGEEILRRRVPSPRGRYADTLRAITHRVDDGDAAAGASAGTATVGVGIPGTISPATGLVKNANSIWLNGQPLAADLPALLGRPVRFANDANCFALSEATDGAGEGAAVVFGVIVGTGTGGGVVVNGRVLVGVNAIGGEWGHNPLPDPRDDERSGPACYCGRRGCIEQFLSGPALSRDYSADGVAAVDVAERARAGEPRAVEALARYVDRMARALGSIVNVVDPDVIVLGGGLSNIEQLYRDVPERWAGYVFSDRVDTRLVRARHGDSSGVRGAAWLWP
jgi:fructokinase